jgi:hypothetical protein
MKDNNSILTIEEQPPGFILLFTHLLFIPLFLLSYFYYKERLFGDSAWYLFRVINSGNFVIEHSRPSLFFWQYSLFHVCFFYLAFIFVTHVLKDFRGGLFILGFQLLGVSDMFFFVPMWEMWYGLIGIVIQMSLLRQGRDSIVLHFILTLYVFMSYPFNIIVWVAFFVFAFPSQYIRKNWLRLSLLFTVCILLKTLWGNQYESEKVSRLFANGLPSMLAEVSNAKYICTFLKFYLQRYSIVSLAVILSMWALRMQKIKCFVFLGMVISAVFVINVVFGVNEFGSNGPTFEAIYYIIPVLCLTVLIYFYASWDSFKQQSILMLSCLAVTATGVKDIVSVSDVYKERVLLMQRTIIRARVDGSSKVLYNDENIKRFNYHYCMFSIPMESMMLSACGNYANCVSIAEEHMFESINQWDTLRPESYLMMNNYVFNISTLNKRYFKLNVEPYLRLNEKNCTSRSTNSVCTGGSADYDHPFTTDHRLRTIYHVNIPLQSGNTLCSSDTGIYWQVKTINTKGIITIHSKQPMTSDSKNSVDDYVLVSTDSMALGYESHICLIKNNIPFASILIH